MPENPMLFPSQSTTAAGGVSSLIDDPGLARLATVKRLARPTASDIVVPSLSVSQPSVPSKSR